VFRYNTLKWANIGWHGTEGSRQRGMRTIEVYNNSFYYDDQDPHNPGSAQYGIIFTGILWRSGSGVVWGNTFTSGGGQTGFHDMMLVTYYRNHDCGGVNEANPFGNADGTNPWDQNAGSHGYVAIDNTGWGKCLDQVRGDTPINQRTGTAAWPRNQMEGVYEWNNSWSPVPQNQGDKVGIQCDSVAIGREVFPDTQMPGYTPYTYPHPLTLSGTPTPTPTGTPSATPTATATPSATATATVTPTSTPTPTASPVGTPLAPSNLIATAVSQSQINIGWQNKDPNAEAIFCERGTDGINFVQFTSLPPNRTGLSDLGLNPATTYYYRVRCRADGEYSAYSNAASATTFGGPTPSPSPTPTPTPPTGLVAAYNFNEGNGTTVNDASGNRNNGTISGATWTSSGKYGYALSFNGSNSRVTVPDSASLHLTTGMTLEAWVYPTATSSQWRDVIEKGNDNYYLFPTPPAAGGSWAEPPLFGTSIPANVWSHLASTYDGARLRLYINGAQVASKSVMGSISVTTDALTFGSDPFYGQYFSGKIDDIRIYNRSLTAAEIQADMNTPVGSR
jgi:hypothetical protein